jgi:hypothetical protein
MSSASLVVTVMAAAATSAAAAVDFARAEWVLANMTRLGIPHSWLSPLGALNAASALGLLVGIGAIGIAASIGLVLYFIGAVLAWSRVRRGSGMHDSAGC